MQTELRAVGSGLQRVAIGLVLLIVGFCLSYVLWVIVIIAGMALSGQ